MCARGSLRGAYIPTPLLSVKAAQPLFREISFYDWSLVPDRADEFLERGFWIINWAPRRSKEMVWEHGVVEVFSSIAQYGPRNLPAEKRLE